MHSERATELIDQLMPAVVPDDHNHGDLIFQQIYKLSAQGDPRAAEVLIAHMCDGGTAGRPMIDALEEIGPPAVPFLLMYLEKDMTQGLDMSFGMYDALGKIGARYRDDLGGIVQHIIIPKLKVVAANYERFGTSTIDARSALSKLQ